jgi:hypothetical protein
LESVDDIPTTHEQALDPSYLDSLREKRRVPTIHDVQKILHELEAHGIQAWLHGGWAVEAILGQSLAHGDVDFLVPADQRPTLTKILGDRVVIERPEYVIGNFDRVQVEFAFFHPYSKGLVWIAHREILWLLLDPAAAGRRFILGKEDVPCAPVPFILAEQEHTVRKKKKALPKMMERAALLRAKLPENEIVASRDHWPYPRTKWNEFLFRHRLLHLFGSRGKS